MTCIKNKILPLLLLLEMSDGCTSNYRESYRSEPPLMALYAELCPDSAVTVRLTHTFRIFEDPVDDPVVPGAMVILWQGRTPLDTLTFQTGIGKYTGNFHIIPLEEYYVTATHPDYPALITEKVVVPLFPDIVNTEIRDTTYTDNNGLHRDVYISLGYKQFTSPDKYLIFNTFFNKSQRIYPRLLQECGKESFINIAFSGVNLNCLQEEGTLVLKAEGVPRTDGIPDTLTLNMGTTSPFFYNYYLALEEQASANTDQVFFQPVLVNSNLNGGYGALLTKNEQQFKIILP
jgi:hypothetical protein